jgi:hypothetical protein
LTAFLGGFADTAHETKVLNPGHVYDPNPKSNEGRWLEPEHVGEIMNIPVRLEDRDAFHLTLEDYLQAVITLAEELARLCRNSVTLQDFRRPLIISNFLKEIHSGFQILNLKNDGTLRRRVDSLKYKVRIGNFYIGSGGFINTFTDCLRLQC